MEDYAQGSVSVDGRDVSQSHMRIAEQRSTSSGKLTADPMLQPERDSMDNGNTAPIASQRDPDNYGVRRIIRNFTPSYVHLYQKPEKNLLMRSVRHRWFIITMSTGIVSILLHQLPYNGHWLRITSDIFFVLNIALFLTFTLISIVRYTAYPELFPAVLRHPHQSLFLATFPIGLATLINMTILVCVPAWGSGVATFAWVLWWIDSVLCVTACFHLTFVM